MFFRIEFDRKLTRRRFRCVGFVGAFLLTFNILSARAQSLPENAKRALFNGDWAAVLAALEKPGVTEPDVTSRMVAAHAYLATNRNNEALVVFLSVTQAEQLNQWRAWTRTLAQKEPQSAVPHYLYGDALARAGELAAAEGEFSRALERNPKMGLALVGRGTVKALQGKYDPAYMDLYAATQAQPDLADAHASLGSLEVMLQNAEGALTAFNDALRLDPTFAVAYNGRGCARYGLGKPDEAAVDFEMAMALLPALMVGQANHGFVLALVARKVDERMRSAEAPGTTLTTRSQAMVIDIPGIWTQGEDRPGKWAPVLLGTSTYERFNIRHEGMESLKAEPGETIVISRNATAEVLRQRLQPVFDAQRRGADVYLKIDQDVGLGAYMSEGWRAEQRWAAGITNVIAQNAKQSYPAMPIYLNTHSHGTGAVFEVDLTPMKGVILASPRRDASEFSRLAHQNTQTKFVVLTGDMDLPHGVAPGFLAMSAPNVTVINFKSGGLNPLKVHSDVQDSMARGFFEVADTTSGLRAQYGTLGNLAANALSAPGSRFGSFTEADLKTALKQEGFTNLSRKLSDHEQRLLTELDGIRAWNLGNPSRINNLNRIAVGTEFAKWGVNLAGLLGPGGVPVFAAKGLFLVAKDGLSKFIGSTYPPPAKSIAKSALAGVTWQGDFLPWKSALQGTQELAVAQREGLAIQQDAVLRRVGSIATELRELRVARQQLAELTVLEMLTNRTVADLGRQPASALASQLTGLAFLSSQPWSQMPDLMKEISKPPGGKPVLLVSQDAIKSFAFERMIQRQGVSAFVVPPLKEQDLQRLGSALSPAAVIGFQSDLDDTHRKLMPFPPPPDKWGGGGAAVKPAIPITRQGNTFTFPGIDGKPVVLPAPSHFNTPPATWDSFKPWTPRGNVGGVRTQDLEWVFVDKGDWPVMTLFTLGYEPPGAGGRIKQ